MEQDQNTLSFILGELLENGLDYQEAVNIALVICHSS